MNVLRTSTHFTRLKRSRQIAQVLARNGLGYIADELRLARFLPGRGSAPGDEPRSRPERVRLVLEELGTTFIKLGQQFSTRSDLLPPEYLQELSKLQDAAPAISTNVAVQVIESELGMPVASVYARFDREPLAAASIGQAHAAALPDGSEVVVKVRRPGVVEQVGEDVEILQNLALAANRHWPEEEFYDFVGLAEEFAATLRSELDFVREGRSAERFAKAFAGDPTVHIPKVHWEHSSSRVLTLERIRGIKVDDLPALEAAGFDRRVIAKRAARMILVMVFEHGFFHADPHPGNLFVEPGGSIGLIDFGMVGTVDEATRERLATALMALVDRDSTRLAEAVLELAAVRGRCDRRGLASDIERLLSGYGDLALGEVALGPLMQEIFAVGRRHRVQLSQNLSLLFRLIMLCEGNARRLDPDFRFIEEIRPFVDDLMRTQNSPLAWAQRLGRAGIDAARLASELPGDVRRLLDALERSNLEFGIRRETLRLFTDGLERVVNRLVLGILAAAFIVGLAVLTLIYHPSPWPGWAGNAFRFAFWVAAVLGGYLAWTVVRSGRRAR